MWEADANHNSIITVGNGGTKPLKAHFTLFYDEGAKHYDLEKTLAPADQMWIDVHNLIDSQVADMNGKTLPSGITMGSYEFQDLTNVGVGHLYEGKVVYDKTNGHVTYGCAICCGYNGTQMFYNPLGVPLSFTAGDGVWGHDSCDGLLENVSESFYNGWSVDNTSIATVVAGGTHTGRAMGSTTSRSSGALESAGNHQCRIVTWLPYAPTSVGKKLDLIASDCSTTSPDGSHPYTVGYTDHANCTLSEQVDIFPASPPGSCVPIQTQSGYEKNCWRYTNSQNCTVTKCAVDHRTAKSDCTKLLYAPIEDVTTICP